MTIDRFATFRDLHQPGNPLLLLNVWDAGSARAVESAGAPALATSSGAVAAARGYVDGEALPLDDLVRCIEQICAVVTVPVSVDLESGYGKDIATVAASALRLARAGAVGCNLEDGIPRTSEMTSVEEQCRRLEGVRAALDAEGRPMFLNARTDIFLKAPAGEHEEHLAAAVARGRAYAEAGADGFFVPGLAEPAWVRRVIESVPLPVNVMLSTSTPPPAAFAEVGVARVSSGGFPYRHLMAQLSREAAEWTQGQTPTFQR